MGTFPQAEVRLFANKYVCQRCKKSMRLQRKKFLAKKAKCKYCSCRNLRPVRKLAKAA